ncbi:MAG: ABC transporter permease [Chloroflexi bacterium]|nr:ABC transporter permease [Chloroflexota bacterium]
MSRLVRRPLSVAGLFGVVLLLLIAVIGPALAPYDPAAPSPARLQPPSAQHLMGTESLGRDELSRFLFGTRVSLFVGLGAVVLGLVVGTLIGMLAGMRAGGAWDTLGMRAMDVVLAFPLLVLVPVLAGILQTRSVQIGPIGLSSIAVVGVAIGLVSIPVFARVARASVLAEMREDYILAARSFGAGGRDLLFGNLLPNIQAPLIVQAAFSLAIAIAAEAAVSFLGLGVQPPDSSWGNMLADARRFVIGGAWWLVVFPSVGIALAVLSFNLVGDALRDALDPRAERS